MKCSLVLLVTVFGAVSVPSAWADDPAVSNVRASSAASHLVALPMAVAGFCAGAVIGTPISFLRKFPKEVTQGAHGFVGSIGNNDSKKLLYVPACVMWLPIAGCVAALEAPGYGLRHAYTAEKPFSKEQFSLGEMDP